MVDDLSCSVSLFIVFLLLISIWLSSRCLQTHDGQHLTAYINKEWPHGVVLEVLLTRKHRGMFRVAVWGLVRLGYLTWTVLSVLIPSSGTLTNNLLKLKSRGKKIRLKLLIKMKKKKSKATVGKLVYISRLNVTRNSPNSQKEWGRI